MAALHNYPVSIEMVVILIMRGGGASEDVEVAGDKFDGDLDDHDDLDYHDDLDDLGDIYCQAHYERRKREYYCFHGGNRKILNINHKDGTIILLEFYWKRDFFLQICSLEVFFILVIFHGFTPGRMH